MEPVKNTKFSLPGIRACTAHEFMNTPVKDRNGVYLITDLTDPIESDMVELPANCPNCNAPTTQSGICEYCGTNIKMYIKHKIDSAPPVFYPL